MLEGDRGCGCQSGYCSSVVAVDQSLQGHFPHVEEVLVEGSQQSRPLSAVDVRGVVVVVAFCWAALVKCLGQHR